MITKGTEEMHETRGYQLIGFRITFHMCDAVNVSLFKRDVANLEFKVPGSIHQDYEGISEL